jgi:hypothetical protein
MPGYRRSKIQTVYQTRNPKAEKKREKDKATAEKLGMTYEDFSKMRAERGMKVLRGEMTMEEHERLSRNEEFGLGSQK